MQTSLTIVRYPTWSVPFAFIAMVVFRFPLAIKKDISFYKLMGSGRNGTFDKTPDLRQWAILCVHTGENNNTQKDKWLAVLYGKFIAGWLRLFHCECFTILLQPVSGHGYWDGKQPFGEMKSPVAQQSRVGTLTRATIRLSKLSSFWKHVAPVAGQLNAAKGFITSFGIGEIPWVKQATFSIWETVEDMKAFAYGMNEHAAVIKKTREQNWYSEDMFVRFEIVDHHGSIKKIDPLAGKM